MSAGPSKFTESVVEDAALEWLEGLGYAVLHGPEIAFGEPAAERNDSGYRDVILERRLRQALEQLNPTLPLAAIEDAYKRLTRLDEPRSIISDCTATRAPCRSALGRGD